MQDAAIPIVTYSERSLFRSCYFKLYADRIEIKGRRPLTSDFETICRLSTLSPETTRIRLRHPWWPAGLLMQLVPFSAFFILAAGENLDRGFALGFLIFLWAMAVGFCVLGLWIFTQGFPKKEFVVFNYLSGTAAFDVGRAGPEKSRFDEVIQSIHRQANFCRAETSSPTT